MPPTIQTSLAEMNKAEVKPLILDLIARKKNEAAYSLMLDKEKICPDVAFDTMRRSGYSLEEIAEFWRIRGDLENVEALKEPPKHAPDKRNPLKEPPAMLPEAYDPRLKWRSCCD